MYVRSTNINILASIFPLKKQSKFIDPTVGSYLDLHIYFLHFLNIQMTICVFGNV